MTDPRDIPRLRYRPCDHCGHRHYHLTDEGDLDNCPMCGGELYPSVTLVQDGTIWGTETLLHFVQHKPRCAALEVMWHKGPCDCGLSMLLKHLPLSLVNLAGPGAVRCTTCGDKGILDHGDTDVRCPNCEKGTSGQ